MFFWSETQQNTHRGRFNEIFLVLDTVYPLMLVCQRSAYSIHCIEDESRDRIGSTTGIYQVKLWQNIILVKIRFLFIANLTKLG
jgi:hypothetical protein